jgi:hypothetical protein
MKNQNNAEEQEIEVAGDCDCDYCSGPDASENSFQALEENKSTPEETSMPSAIKSTWSRDDKNILISMFKQGSVISEMAEVLHRSEMSIVWKLVHLGYLSDIDISNMIFRAQKRFQSTSSFNENGQEKTTNPRLIQAVVVANSYKNHGRCLAVIELQTSELIRPVTAESNRSVQESSTFLKIGTSKHQLKPGDFVTIPLLGEDSKYWQRENWFLDPDKRIEILANDQEFLKVRARNACKEHYELPDFLLADQSPYVDESDVSRANASLELRLITNVKIHHRTRANGKAGLRAEFTYRGKEFSLAYTDENSKFVHGTKLERAMACLSLGEPIKGKHYKLIAGLLPVN